MKLWRNKASAFALAFAGAGILVGLPALGQEAPESLLPPGFGDPASAPPPQQAPSTPDRGASPTAPAAPVAPPSNAANPAETLPAAEPGADGEALPEDAFASLLPPEPVRPLGAVGPLYRSTGGLGDDAFAGTDGRALVHLMRRLNAPLPSRWESILLRRALLSNVPTPSGVSAPDWVAERAWLLLRMGEADSARLLIQSVDANQYSPWLFAVAMQTQLALGDPAGLCPLVEPASAVSRDTGWMLARAMCAALSGEPGTATAAIEQARNTRLRGRRTIDLLLAEKVVGAGANGRRSVTIEWDKVNTLNSWRYGLAAAVNVPIPERLFKTVGPQVQGWRIRAPFLPDSELLGAGRDAAVLGVLSSAALVDLYGGLLDRTDPSEIAGTPMIKLRDAYAAADIDDRMAAMRDLWGNGEDAQARFAGLILTARAAGRVPASADLADDTPLLLASMYAAGLDNRADLWSRVVGDSDDGWALLAVGSQRPRVAVNAGRAGDYAGSVDPHKGALFIAALAGLGRISLQDAQGIAADLNTDIARTSKWSNLLGRAAANGQQGTVALLAAVGMQTREWQHVPAAHLYHIVSALRQVGLEAEARMIAAEALTRL
ncbi:hypothetical protein [Sphingomonas sp. C3-2]|uniref:hypothetical protein n=1 Tax=Sphingomonas sp. C3-2 TaxID=3062169 RepID=UPI00294AEF9B|nr:hypothetical protein [Sphingomonas sp. C3-2]WOK37104.1 hypothetical protein QYC26_02625 [Sphingomonas sp. C3-2]